MRALVTGANGFIGSHLVRLLLASGCEVRAMVRGTSDLGRLAGLSPQLCYADVAQPASLPAAVEGVDVVFHLAGAISAANAAGFDAVNRGGTANLLDAVRSGDGKLGRFVLVSSAAAAGPSQGAEPKTEDAPPAPVSAYGRSKLAAERTLRELASGVPTTVVRPPIVYGSADTATLSLFRLVRRRIAPYLPGPERPLSFVHVGDLVRGLLRAATAPEAIGETFALTGPESGTLRHFLRAIAAELRVRALEVPVPARALRLAGFGADLLQRVTRRPHTFSSDKVRDALQPGWLVSGEKARTRLAFVPVTDLREGVREALSGYRRQGWL